MNKHRVLIDTFLEGRHRAKGEEFDIPSERAAEYVEAGLVEPVESTEVEKPKKASKAKD